MLLEITCTSEENKSQKTVSFHGNHYNFIFSQDMESVLSLLLSALCSLSPEVIEWVAYGTLHLLSDFADFQREKLLCKVLHLSIASERTDFIKIFQVCENIFLHTCSMRDVAGEKTTVTIHPLRSLL